MLRKAAQRTRTAVVFRSIRMGEHVTLLGRGKLYVDKTDRRGQRLLEAGGPLYPWPALVWAEVARRLKPTLFLDIGANYGEISLSSTYKSDAKVYLFEPNTRILPYLKKNISEHRNSEQLILIPAFVSNEAGVRAFKANKEWSGASYGIDDLVKSEAADEKFEILSVPTLTIDDLIGLLPNLQSCRLQFKVDVEGFERQVLLGMSKVLSQVSAFAGVLEFDAMALARAKTDPLVFFKELTRLGNVWEIKGGQVRVASFDRLHAHTDLIVASPNSFRDFALPALVRILYRLDSGEPKSKAHR